MRQDPGHNTSDRARNAQALSGQGLKMAHETRTTPDGQEVRVHVISEADRKFLDAFYERYDLNDTDAKIEFLKRYTGMLHYHCRDGYAKDRHLRALEREILLRT